MEVQLFKGDEKELKIKAVIDPLFDITDDALDSFFEQGYDAIDFLLMLYDEQRMPFSTRVDRDTFISFVKEAFDQFPVTGTFESYVFILKAIFGDETMVQFDIPTPGKLSLDVQAGTDTPFDWVASEFIDGVYVISEMVDDDLAQLQFTSIPGIETDYQLTLLFSEIIPAGITPDISLNFFTISDFIADEGSDIYDMITDNFDNIIFFETGG